jgi:DNA anti-recombination protein RmuC
MGFKTLSINEKAKEIVKDLGKAKKEFNKFSKSTELLIKGAEGVLNRAREQGTRERAMSRALNFSDLEDHDTN